VKTFIYRKHLDSGTPFVRALEEAGYKASKENGLFYLFDCENVGRRREYIKDILSRMPGFIYPHTPFTSWLWDGPYQALPVQCNFVSAPGHKEIMRRYGYKSRVEVVGFPRCEVREFTPTTGTKVLFVPARPRKDDGRHARKDQAAFDFLMKHRSRFESVTVCHTEGRDFVGDFTPILTDPKQVTSPADNMRDLVEQYDLIVAVNTPAALAVAIGKPTIFFDGDEAPETNRGKPAMNYDEYREILCYPLQLSQMDIYEVLDTREAPNQAVERWKADIIGGNFDGGKVVEVIEEYL